VLAKLMAEFQAESATRVARLPALLRQCATFHPPRPSTPEEALCQQALAENDAFYDRWYSAFKSEPGAEPFVAGLIEGRLSEKIMILSGLANAYRLDGRLPEARAVCEQALALFGEAPDPGKASLLASLARDYAAIGETSKAKDRLQGAIDEYGRMADVVASQLAGVPEGHEEERHSLSLMQVGFVAQQARLWSDRADLAIAEGRGPEALQQVGTAIELANRLPPTSLQGELRLKLLRFELMSDATGEVLRRASEDSMRRRLRKPDDPALTIDSDLLLANTYLDRGDAEQAMIWFNKALAESEKAPQKRWNVLFNLASAQEHGDTSAALATYELALAAARELGATPEAEATTLCKLIPLGLAHPDPRQQATAEQRINELRTRGDRDTLAAVLPQRALLSLKASDRLNASALHDLSEAEQLATSPEQRFQVSLGRVAAHRSGGRSTEALKLIVRTLDELEKLATASGSSIADRPTWIRLFGSLHESAACISVDIGRLTDALDWTERGRAIQLRRDLADPHAPSLADQPVVSFHPWLVERRSGLVYLCVTGRRTLVLGLTPDSAEPIAEFVEIGEEDVMRLLPTDKVGVDWNSSLFVAARELESRLGPPLARLAERCSTLYIVPDSRLGFLPFAALTCPDGKTLLEKCALALAPSFGILRRCHARALGTRPSTCLAIGVGKANPRTGAAEDDFEFQAALIASLKWKTKEVLLGANVVGKRVLEALAVQRDVVHIATHGKIDGEGQLSSSRLVMADSQNDLSALEIAKLHGQLRTDLVFLNACVSGRFEKVLSGEVGGFWEAFLRAGTPTLVAPLSYVDPKLASELAFGFHARRLGGPPVPGDEHVLSVTIGKAEALRQSQLSLRVQHPNPEDWATHVLIGDGQ